MPDFTALMKAGLAPKPCPMPHLPRPDDDVSVERMARAIWMHCQRGRVVIYEWEQDQFEDFVREVWREEARAALAALWEGV